MPSFFADAASFRRWLVTHSSTSKELLVGFFTIASGKKCITWPEAVDEALCVGWIDGVRRNLDSESYQIRFTPRKPTSRWSAVNIRRVAILRQEGRMSPAGLAAFAHRTEARSRTASYEQIGMPALDAKAEAAFKRNRKAWEFFQNQAPSYRKKALWIVVSAKQEATRQRRLEGLISASAQGQRR